MKWVVIFLSTVFPISASAEPASGVARRSLNNFSNELITCSAYFNIVSAAMHNSGNGDGEKQYKDAASDAFDFGAMAAEEAGLLPATNIARLEIALKEMIKKINQDTVNISILYNEYADLCLEAMDNPTARAAYWIEKVMSE